MNKTIHLDIYTPTGKYLSTEVDFVKVTSSVAVLGILPGHAPLVTTLEICQLTLKANSKEEHYAISGGVLNIKKDRSVVMLVNAIEHSEEIDFARAEESKKRAEERLKNKRDDIDIARAQAALSRALNRLSLKDK